MEDKNHPEYYYYLFYDINGTKTFHSPIEEKDISKYNLEIVKIDHLQTEGHEITELVSTQFVKKVLALIDAGGFQLILSKPKKCNWKYITSPRKNHQVSSAGIF